MGKKARVKQARRVAKQIVTHVQNGGDPKVLPIAPRANEKLRNVTVSLVRKEIRKIVTATPEYQAQVTQQMAAAQPAYDVEERRAMEEAAELEDMLDELEAEEEVDAGKEADESEKQTGT